MGERRRRNSTIQTLEADLESLKEQINDHKEILRSVSQKLIELLDTPVPFPMDCDSNEDFDTDEEVFTEETIGVYGQGYTIDERMCKVCPRFGCYMRPGPPSISALLEYPGFQYVKKIIHSLKEESRKVSWEISVDFGVERGVVEVVVGHGSTLLNAAKDCCNKVVDDEMDNVCYFMNQPTQVTKDLYEHDTGSRDKQTRRMRKSNT